MVKLKEEEKRQMAQEESAHNKEAKKEETKAPKVKIKATMKDLDVIYYPLVTEKAVNMIDAENKITFVVSEKANKGSVKNTVEKAYGVKVENVNIIRDRKGRKKAVVRLKKESKAQDLATKLGVL